MVPRIVFEGFFLESRSSDLAFGQSFRKLKLKEITQLVDYVQFCQAGAHDKDIDLDLLENCQRISPKEMLENHSKSLIIDVR